VEELEPYRLSAIRSGLEERAPGLYRDDGGRRWAAVCEHDRWAVELVPGLLNLKTPHLAALGPRLYVVADAGAWKIFGRQCKSYLAHWNIDYGLSVLSGGEGVKSLSVVEGIVRDLDKAGAGRDQVIVALGGGATLDVVGVVAQGYRRGVPWVRVPTTLIGAIDAGVGLKVGVNVGTAKNRVGGYCPSLITYVDPGLIATSRPEDIAGGFAEALKIGLVRDARIVGWLEAHAEGLRAWRGERDTPMQRVIEWSIDAMLTELQANPREADRRRLSDYGHAVGPLLERRANIRHGDGVAVDMALMWHVATERGHMSPEGRERLLDLAGRLGIPTTHPALTPELLADGLAEVVRQRGGNQHLPLPDDRGGPVQWGEDVEAGELAHAAAWLASR